MGEWPGKRCSVVENTYGISCTSAAGADVSTQETKIVLSYVPVWQSTSRTTRTKREIPLRVSRVFLLLVGVIRQLESKGTVVL